jgi:hypothetical protein
VVAVSLVDVPKGLDEGETAIAYEGASAHLLAGFWLQIAAAAVAIAAGLLLPPYLRSAQAPATPARAGRSRRPRRALRSRVQEARA